MFLFSIQPIRFALCFGLAIVFAQSASAQLLTPDEIYEKLNMRGFSSSLAVALKRTCYVYPKDYFKLRGVKVVSPTELVMKQGIHRWTIRIKKGNQIDLLMRVGSAPFVHPDPIKLFFDDNKNEWFSREMNIELPDKCRSESVARSQRNSQSIAGGGQMRSPRPTKPVISKTQTASTTFVGDKPIIHNRWKSQARYVNRYQVGSAAVWKDQLVLSGSRLANFGVDCEQSRKVPCEGEASVISRVNLTSGQSRSVYQEKPVLLNHGRLAQDTRRLVSNNHLIELSVLKDRRNYDTYVQVTNLHTGKRVFSNLIRHYIIDAVVEGPNIVISHRQPGSSSRYNVKVLRMNDAAHVFGMTSHNHPVLTDQSIVTFDIDNRRGPTKQVTVRTRSLTGRIPTSFTGKWPRVSNSCGKADNTLVNDSSRFIALIDRCGKVRTIDLVDKRVISYSPKIANAYHFVGTENYLMISSVGKEISHALDLRTGRLALTRLSLSAGQLISAGQGQDAVLSVLPNLHCANSYADQNTGVVLRTEYQTQRIRLVDMTKSDSTSANGPKQRTFPIAQSVAANSARNRPRNKTRPNVIAMQPVANADALDSRSVGEFRFAFSKNMSRSHWDRSLIKFDTYKKGFCEYIRAPLFGADRRTQTGWFGAALKRSAVDSPAGPVWVVDRSRRELTQLAELHRNSESRSLLVFEVAEGGWYNLSADPARPLWIGGPSLPSDFHQRFASRGTVIAQSARIYVRSGHRIRSGPAVAFDEIETLHPDTPLTIEPLEVNGDWLKVKFGEGRNREAWRSGWLKWRGAAGDEWVRAEFGH